MRFQPCLALALLLLPTTAAAEEPASVAPEAQAIAAWEAYCDRLKAAGAEMLATYPQPAEIDRAEGLRYLAQQVSAALDQELLAQPGELALLRVGATTLNKWGLDGADAKYIGADLDPTGTYRLSGRKGNARLIAVQTAQMAPRYRAFASITGEEFDAAGDGSFEVMLAGERPAGWDGPWLELDANSTSLLMREYFGDWEREHPGEYFLTRVDAAPASPPLSLDESAALLMRSAARFETRAPQWLPRVQPIRDHLVNRLRIGSAGDGGLQTNVYGNGLFRLAPDEVAIIELEAPQAALWSFQLGNVWWESLDYVNRTGSLNGDQAVPGSDGRYRLVIAHEDPGVPNWLDTAAHPEGMILFRYQLTENAPEPTIELAKLADLTSTLPADTPRVTPEGRAEEIAVRRAHAARRWAP